MGTEDEIHALAFESLSEDQYSRREQLQDVFGLHLFQLRNELLEELKVLLREDKARQSLGRIKRSTYERVSELETDKLTAIEAVVRENLDKYIQALLSLLGHIGADLRLGQEHHLRYRVILEILESRSAQSCEECTINSIDLWSLSKRYGRWLNMYSDTTPTRSR